MSLRKDGKFSLRIAQVSTEGRTWRVRGLRGFRRGSALFGFLDTAWRKHTGDVVGESTWIRIAGDIKQRDGRLGEEVLAAVEESLHRAHTPVEAPSPALVAAYRDTDYTVLSGEISLRVDGMVPNLDDWLRAHGGRSAVIITAFNPFSVQASDAMNRQRQRQLRACIEGSGLCYSESIGTARSGNWPGEPSFCVLDPTGEDVDEWLLHFGQYAVVLAAIGMGCRLLWHPAIRQRMTQGGQA